MDKGNHLRDSLLLPSIRLRIFRIEIAQYPHLIAPNKGSHKNPTHCFDHCNCQQRNNNPENKGIHLDNREDGHDSGYTILRNDMTYNWGCLDLLVHPHYILARKYRTKD